MYTPENWPIAAKMNFGSCTKDGTPLHLAHSSVWADHLQQVADVGFTAIDPIDDWVEISELSDSQWVEFKAVLKDFNFKIPAISFGRRSLVDVNNAEENARRMRCTAVRLAELGGNILNLGFMQELTAAQKEAVWFWHEVGHQDDFALRELAIRRVRELANFVQPLGLELSLEVYEDTFTDPSLYGASFVKDIDHESVGINPDLGNIIRLHKKLPSPQSMFDEILPYANYWHIKNYSRDFDPKTGMYTTFPTALESGYINYRDVIRQALELGYRGAFQTEHYGGDWLGIGARNMQYIRSVLAGAKNLID